VHGLHLQIATAESCEAKIAARVTLFQRTGKNARA
jgi:hypothetical protein